MAEVLLSLHMRERQEGSGGTQLVLQDKTIMRQESLAKRAEPSAVEWSGVMGIGC